MTRTAVSAIRTGDRRRLRLVPAPRHGGLFDDDIGVPGPLSLGTGPARPEGRPGGPVDPPGASSGQGAPDAHGTQGTLALAFTLPSGVPAVPAPSPRLRIVGRELLGSSRRLSAVPEAGVIGRPDASRWAALIAQAIIEAEVGDRPLSQLVPWTNDEVIDAVAARCSRHAERNAPARRSMSRAVVASIHVCRLGDDVAEACATVRWADRARAIALRLDGAGVTWRCTAVSFG